MARIRRVITTLFGHDDLTPRGIQERKDMYWIVLAVAHRKLRMGHQKRLLQDATSTNPLSSLVWQEESKKQLKDQMEEAASHLDDKTDLNELPLVRLRTEIQSFLKPQIIHLLTAAHDAEEEMVARHGGGGEEEEEYVFSAEEELEYKEILLREYDTICQLLTERKEERIDKRGQQMTPDPSPYYEIKKGAIETALTFFDWWPEDSNIPTKSADADEEDYVDEFGFSPNTADSEILPAMRYYHVRNLIRSSLVRRARVNTDNSNDENTQQPHCYHSLLPFKSTIPSAGRGVFVDGYAPAGTLIAFLPGKVWPKEHLQTASTQTQMQLTENDPRDQLSMRYDDILIDSRHSPYTVVQNLWALGHIVNHPPAPAATSAQHTASQSQSGEECNKSDNVTHTHPHQGPNCGIVPINFTDRMLDGNSKGTLRDYIPNEYEAPPKNKNASNDDEIIMHGLGLVALRDVKDEELFYDYRMSLDAEAKGKGGDEYPSWYHVWDQDAINSRWDVDE